MKWKNLLPLLCLFAMLMLALFGFSASGAKACDTAQALLGGYSQNLVVNTLAPQRLLVTQPVFANAYVNQAALVQPVGLYGGGSLVGGQALISNRGFVSNRAFVGNRGFISNRAFIAQPNVVQRNVVVQRNGVNRSVNKVVQRRF